MPAVVRSSRETDSYHRHLSWPQVPLQLELSVAEGSAYQSLNYACSPCSTFRYPLRLLCDFFTTVKLPVTPPVSGTPRDNVEEKMITATQGLRSEMVRNGAVRQV